MPFGDARVMEAHSSLEEGIQFSSAHNAFGNIMDARAGSCGVPSSHATVRVSLQLFQPCLERSVVESGVCTFSQDSKRIRKKHTCEDAREEVYRERA